jgi:hypothetical protein
MESGFQCGSGGKRGPCAVIVAMDEKGVSARNPTQTPGTNFYIVAKKHVGTFSLSVEELRSWLTIGDGEVLDLIKTAGSRARDKS